MTEDALKAEERIQTLYGAARDAVCSGDNAQACALVEELLPLVEPAGSSPLRRAQLLGTIAQLLVVAESYARAIELWSEAIPLAEAHGDLEAASWMLDSVAEIHANQGAWRRAVQAWEHALEIDTRLGSVHNRAVTLANIAPMAARMGDKLVADSYWNKALALFEASNQAASAIALGRAVYVMASLSGDWSDPLGLHARVLCLAEAAGDARGQLLSLDGMGHASAQLHKYAEALAYWERACVVATELGDAVSSASLQSKIARCQQGLRGEKSTPHGSIPPRDYPSVSEYTVQSDAALAFLVGELWAALHARGMSLRGLKPGDVTINPGGVACLSPGVRLTAGTPFEPAAAAADLASVIECYSRGEAAGLLAGYSRCAYELLDRSQPGFTDAVLDHFGVPGPRWGARALDVAALLAALGVEVCVDQEPLSLALLEAKGPSPFWQEDPELAFQLVVALFALGVDCRAVLERDAAVSWPLFGLLLRLPAGATDPEPDIERWMPFVSPRLSIAAKLAYVLGQTFVPKPLNFGRIFNEVRDVLAHGSDAEMEFGDILIDVALFCAKTGQAQTEGMSYQQAAVILLGYTTRGQRSDEARLLLVTRALYDLPELFPSPLEPWPSTPGHWLWVWNSLLITLRDLTTNSIAAQKRGQVGVLRSAYLRGLRTARHLLPLSYAYAMSRDPETAAHGLTLVRATIRNYATLVARFFESVALELDSTGLSAWLPWLKGEGEPTHIERELSWTAEFLLAAVKDDFSLDAVRPFMRSGAEFYAQENTHFVLPSSSDVRLTSN